jgi:type II secretory pathway pseudopilin PulG
MNTPENGQATAKDIYYCERASTILELICSMLLLAIIAAGAVGSLRNGLSAINISVEQGRLAQKSQMIFHRIGSASHAPFSNLAKTIVISTADSLRDLHGRRHQLYLRNDDLRPSATSDTISTAHPSLGLLMIRTGTTTSSNTYCLIVDKWPPRSTPSKIKSWLALSPDGQVHVQAQINFLRDGKLCSKGREVRATLVPISHSLFTYRTSRETLSTNEMENLLSKHFALVSLQDAYTLYVDSVGTLRRYSEHSRDNQPLVDGILTLKLEQVGSPAGLRILNAKLKLRSKYRVKDDFTRTFILADKQKVNPLLILDGETR